MQPPPAAPPPAPPPGGYGPVAAAPSAPTDTSAVVALVLGILSIITCCVGPILGAIAFFVGNSALGRIRASGGAIGGEGLAQAGRITGIVGFGIGVLWVLYFIFVFGISALNSSH